jgi:large subunit ribosomal protein L30
MARTFVWHPTRGPKHTDKAELTDGEVRVEQVRSGIGQPARMRQTLQALGLRHHQDFVVRQDSPSLRGQVRHVRHLVRVTPLSGRGSKTATEGGPAAKKPRAKVTRAAKARKNNG